MIDHEYWDAVRKRGDLERKLYRLQAGAVVRGYENASSDEPLAEIRTIKTMMADLDLIISAYHALNKI